MDLSNYIHKDIIKFILSDYIDYYDLDFYQKFCTHLYKNPKRYIALTRFSNQKKK